MIRIIGYRDLRPVDWASGKRMPLEPGAGHLCDRCGREHAILFEVEDTDTDKTYTVGSGCAKRQFGFDTAKDPTAKALMEEAKRLMEAELDVKRQSLVTVEAARIAAEVAKLEVPPVVLDPSCPYANGREVWRCGDSRGFVGLDHYGNTPDDAKRNARSYWLQNRITELLPKGWGDILLINRPERRSLVKTSMSHKTIDLALKALRP